MCIINTTAIVFNKYEYYKVTAMNNKREKIKLFTIKQVSIIKVRLYTKKE